MSPSVSGGADCTEKPGSPVPMPSNVVIGVGMSGPPTAVCTTGSTTGPEASRCLCGIARHGSASCWRSDANGTGRLASSLSGGETSCASALMTCTFESSAPPVAQAVTDAARMPRIHALDRNIRFGLQEGGGCPAPSSYEPSAEIADKDSDWPDRLLTLSHPQPPSVVTCLTNFTE